MARKSEFSPISFVCLTKRISASFVWTALSLTCYSLIRKLPTELQLSFPHECWPNQAKPPHFHQQITDPARLSA